MINDENKRKNNIIRLNMNQCNSSKNDQRWRMEIIEENYNENTTKNNTTTKKNTNTTTVIEKDIPISKNYKCGSMYGRCGENLCCSK